MSADAEVLVLGGGPAGSAAALALSCARRRVLLVEREAAPREKVCGEFLGVDAAETLAALGLPPASLGAVPIGRARLAAGRATADVALPFPAWGLPRRVLDEALLDAAAAAGATLLRGAVAREARREGTLWTLRLADGAVLRAPRLVLATGKHELRGLARAATGGAVGLKVHLRLRAPVEGVNLLACAGGYAGLQPSAGGAANLCAALRGVAMPRDSAALVAHVAAGSALAAALLDGAEPVHERPLAVAGVPYGFIHRDAAGADAALYRVGDQFSVIPSLAGDGMAMALAGGLAAARAILADMPAPAFHAAWRRDVARPMRWAGAAAALLAASPAATARAASLPGAFRLLARRTRLRDHAALRWK